MLLPPMLLVMAPSGADQSKRLRTGTMWFLTIWWLLNNPEWTVAMGPDLPITSGSGLGHLILNCLKFQITKLYICTKYS